MASRESEFKTLTDVGTIGRGKSKHRPRNDPDLYGGDYPFVQTGDVKHAPFYLTEYTQTYNERGLAQSKLWPPGTLCITIAANIADTAILKLPACFPDSILGFAPKRGLSDVRYVKYCLDGFRAHLELISRGTTQDNLSLDKLLKLRFWFPDIDLQRKIAAILSTYDDLIANNQRRIAMLEGMAEEIYREWFVRMRFPGYASAKREHGLPAGWRAGSATEVVNVLGGGTPRTEVQAYWDGEIPFFSPKDSHSGAICIETEQTITETGLESCASQLFEANTIFITARGTVGNIVLAGEPMAMNQSCYALVPKNRAYLYFVFVGLRCAVSVIKGVSNSGVFDNIVMDTFKIIPMIDPGSELAAKFSNLAKPVFEQSLALRRANQALRTQRDALLPRLFSGKLKVDHLDIGLPPSMRAEAEAVA